MKLMHINDRITLVCDKIMGISFIPAQKQKQKDAEGNEIDVDIKAKIGFLVGQVTITSEYDTEALALANHAAFLRVLAGDEDEAGRKS